jgi:uncharacterized membrane protein
MATFMGGAAVTHFSAPQHFEPLVPDWLPGPPRSWVYASGVVELSCAVLLLVPRTRRAGGWLTAATIAGGLPINLQAALAGGMPGARPPFDTAAGSWLRIPFQIPLIREAIQVGRGT